MTKHIGVRFILLALVLALTLLAGCGGQSGEGGEEPGGNGGEAQDREDGEQSEAALEEASAGFFSSDGIDDNGYWTGIRALDHVDLFDYQAIAVPSEVHAISDETVQNEVGGILAGYASNRQVLDRAVENGDTVNIDYVGSVDGVEFENGTTGGMGTDVTIGVTSYIDDFLEQLIGHSPGETINVEVTFPENYGVEELNGKDALFITTINYIVETVAPELDDDFVAENFLEGNGWATVEEMNRGLFEQMQTSAILSYTQEYLMENANVRSVPEELLAYMENSLVSYYREGADYYGVEMGEFLAGYAGVATVEELLEVYYDDNVEQAQYYLIVQAVAEDAQITAGEADVAAYFARYGGTDDYSQFEEQYGMPYLKQAALNQLVLDYLVDHAVLE